MNLAIQARKAAFASCLLLLCCLAASAQTPATPPAQPSPLTQSLARVLDQGELLLNSAPGIVADPLDFGQMARYKLQILSLDGQSWTTTRFSVEGINGSDPYQPGRPLVFPGPIGVSELTLAQADLMLGPTVTYHFALPVSKWHLNASGILTGSPLFSNNLPAAGSRGNLQRSEQFNHFYQPGVELGGRVNRKIDFLFTGGGRWATETIPEAATNLPIHVYHLFGTVRATLRPNAKNTIDVLLIGSRMNSSGWATPFALEAIAGQRMAPPIVGNPNLREEDHPDFVQVGWSRTVAGGAFQLRYGYSTAHIDTVATNLPTDYQSLVTQNLVTTYLDIANGQYTVAPLLQTLEVRPRHSVTGSWTLPFGFTMTATAERAKAENRMLWPPYILAVTANGVADSATFLNTPNDALTVTNSLEIGLNEHLRLGQSLTADLGATFSDWAGDIPAQTSPTAQGGGTARSYPVQPGIRWKHLAPRVALAWRASGAGALVLRAGAGRQ